jgi:hypothetical protein
MSKVVVLRESKNKKTAKNYEKTTILQKHAKIALFEKFQFF